MLVFVGKLGNWPGQHDHWATVVTHLHGVLGSLGGAN